MRSSKLGLTRLGGYVAGRCKTDARMLLEAPVKLIPPRIE
jgi:hypothetical protein